MAKNKGKLFSGKNGRRDWDEPDEDEYGNEYDEDEEEEEAPARGSMRQLFIPADEEGDYDADEEDEPARRGALLSSAKKLFASRKEEDDEDEEEEPVRQRKGFALKSLFARKKAEKDDYDYDYDDDPDAEESVSYEEYEAYGEVVAGDSYEEEETYSQQENGEEFYFEEDAPADEEYYGETSESEYAETYEEAYEESDSYEEEVVPEEEDSYDPFAVFAAIAANPHTEGGYEEEYADEAYEEEAYTEEDYSEEDYEEAYSEEGYEEDYPEEDYAEEGYEEEAYDDFGEDEEEESPSHFSHGSSAGLSRFLMPALTGVAVLALCAIAFATVTLLGSPKYENEKNPKAKASSQPTPVAVQETEAPKVELTETEKQAMGLATPVPGLDSSVKAKRDAEGRIVPDVGGAVVPIRSFKRSADDFAGSAMIGNSFVEGMSLWSDLKTLKYICADGVNLDNMIGNYLYYVTVQNYDSIYLCLGLNEIGWGADTFIKKYEKVIDYIRSDGTSKTKNATIYVVSVMPVEEIMETVPGESGSTISKSTIVEFNERLKTMCQEKGCWFLDVYSALANDKGYLSDSVAADDHVHFEKTGYRIWTDYLMNHYVDEQLLGG